MELRSFSSTRQRTSLPNLTPRNFTDNSSAMSKALRNPLILDIIFSQLNNFDLRTARHVCREWGDVGAGLLGKRAFFHVNQLFRYNGSELYQVIPANDKLMRNLIIWDDFNPSVPSKKTASVITKLFSELSSNVREFTREIAFYITLKKFAIAFLNGLRTLKSTTKIQHISIFIQSTNPLVDKGRIQTLRKLPLQRNLTSITFEIPPPIQEGGSGIHAFQPLLQVLIDSAPKLTSLDVTASFLSLEGCRNLKVLKFLFANCNHEECHNFKLASVATMLTSVKDSLIELELGYADVHVFSIGLIHDPQAGRYLDVPVMPNLVSLTITPLYVYPIQNFFDEKHFPKLRNVSLKKHQFEVIQLSSHLLNLWKPHRGVEYLALEARDYCRDDRKFGETIVQLFPKVTKLEVALSQCEDDVNEVVEPLKVLKLEEFKLVLWHVNVASKLVKVLRSLAIWKGVKSVYFKWGCIEKADFSASIQDIILYSRGFKRVEISGFVARDIVKVIRPIFEASGAPVDFRGGVYRNMNFVIMVGGAVDL